MFVLYEKGVLLNVTKYTSLARKLPKPIYKVLSQAFIDKEFPRHIFIETTSACNLSCSYCPREKRSDHMDYNLFMSIVDECSIHGPRSFSLHLFGEPLLYPRILDAIRYIKFKNKHHTVLLTTNGTLLNRFSRSLLEVGVDRVIWSWRKNNFDDDSIDLLRKRGLIRLLIEETPAEEFERWKTFPRVEIKHLHNYGGHIDISKWGLQSLDDSLDRWPCYHLWLAPAVRWNGDITICCNDPTGRESLGAYPQTSLSEVWRGEKLKLIRESHLKAEYGGLCKGCDSWKAYPEIFFGWQKKCSKHSQALS